MPYTLAHPAAILPIYRWAAPYTSVTALAIGSMAPDFVYFVPLPITGAQSHGLLGIFWFCIPSGFLLWVLLHFFLKPPVLAFLPPAMGTRLAALLANNKRMRGFNWHSAGVLVLSLALGALTHIIWDSFTHWNTIVVRNVEFLRMWVSLPFGRSVRLFTVLQHASTVVGLSILALAGWYGMRHVKPLSPQQVGSISHRNRIILIVAMALCAAIGGAWALPADFMHARLEPVLFKWVVGCMNGAGLCLLLACFVWDSYQLKWR
jgi:Domain of unknown function (DUF4184)